MRGGHSHINDPELSVAVATTSERPARLREEALASPATASTLQGYAGNGDGTYDGRKAIRWLVEAVTGKPMSAEEADEIVQRAMARRK